jgi:hypothetical protein
LMTQILMHGEFTGMEEFMRQSIDRFSA